jgi:hypothetical protein
MNFQARSGACHLFTKGTHVSPVAAHFIFDLLSIPSSGEKFAGIILDM